MNPYERRIRAFSIDMSLAMLILFVLIGIANAIDNVDDYVMFGASASIAYFGSMIVPNFFSKGQSFGKRNQKLRVVDIKTEKPASLLLVLLREIVKGLLMIWTAGFYTVVCGIMASSRKDGRVIHDLIFRTKVVCLTLYTTDREEPSINQTTAMKKRMEGSTHD